MNKTVYAAVLLSMALSTSLWAAPPSKAPATPVVPAPSAATPAASAPTPSSGYDAKAACERYAQEDQIKPDKMDDYMSQCLRDLGNDQAPEQDLDPAAVEQQLDLPKEPTPVKPK